MADNTNIIVVGNVAFTDQGTWKSDYSYEEDGQTVRGYDEGDIVHTSTGVYASLEDGNTTTPSDTNTKWRRWLDKTPTIKAQSAADDANKAANLAQSAANTAQEQATAAAAQAALAETKATEADAAAKRADAKIAQMDGLAGQIATGFIAPSRMNLTYPGDKPTQQGGTAHHSPTHTELPPSERALPACRGRLAGGRPKRQPHRQGRGHDQVLGHPHSQHTALARGEHHYTPATPSPVGIGKATQGGLIITHHLNHIV